MAPVTKTRTARPSAGREMIAQRRGDDDQATVSHLAMPPLTLMSSPVTNDDASLAR